MCVVTSAFSFVLLITSVVKLCVSLSDSAECKGEHRHLFGCECLEFHYEPQGIWDTANNKCKAKGGYLITIKNETKQNFVKGILASSSDKNGVWIGLKRGSSGFNWVDDGSSVNDGFSSWGSDEPDNYLGNQNCVLMHRSFLWSWKTFQCSFEPYSFICQYDLCPKIPPDKGISTAVVIGIVAGSIIGLICLLGILFFLISVIRKCIRQKSNRAPAASMRELEQNLENQENESMINISNANDLDRRISLKRSATLKGANVPAIPSAEIMALERKQLEDNDKILNTNQTDGKTSTEGDMSSSKPDGFQRQASVRSVEDNVLSANSDLGNTKLYTSSVSDINKF